MRTDTLTHSAVRNCGEARGGGGGGRKHEKSFCILFQATCSVSFFKKIYYYYFFFIYYLWRDWNPRSLSLSAKYSDEVSSPFCLFCFSLGDQAVYIHALHKGSWIQSLHLKTSVFSLFTKPFVSPVYVRKYWVQLRQFIVCVIKWQSNKSAFWTTWL